MKGETKIKVDTITTQKAEIWAMKKLKVNSEFPTLQAHALHSNTYWSVLWVIFLCGLK